MARAGGLRLWIADGEEREWVRMPRSEAVERYPAARAFRGRPRDDEVTAKTQMR
jgi:hypothetical protein